MHKIYVLPVAAMLALSASAAAPVELVSPTNGAVVAIVPDAQKKVIALPTLAERIKLFVEDRVHGGKVIRHDGYWRKSKPLRLKWSVPGPGKWAAKVEIGKKPDLSDARVWYVGASKTDDASGREKADGGADRTGSLCYVLNGVLGVDRHDLEVDWESTFYPKIPDENPDPKFWCRESHFNDGFSKYGKEGDSWNRRIELYLLDCGVTEAEIATFREIMLEPDDKKLYRQ